MVKKYRNNIERISFNVSIDRDSGCWNWRMSLNRKGYGLVQYIVPRRKNGRTRKSISSHRLSYMTFCGPIPDGKYVLHKCDNRKCCNPDHLFIGTQMDNMHDMLLKGRGADKSGEKNPRAIIRDSLVSDIKTLIRSGYYTKRDIARYCGIGEGTVYSISSGRNWRHVR